MRELDDRFWDKVRDARDRLLALDYDGTLAPFQVDRMAARPMAGIPEALEAIARRDSTRVAIVSGRPIHELAALIGELSDRLVLVGNHGWESREPGREIQQIVPPPLIERQLKVAYELALEFGKRNPGRWTELVSRVERKNASVAVHTRGMDSGPADVWLESVIARWAGLASPALEILEFNGGIELRVRSRQKGTAIRDLLQRFPATGLTVYLGDDLTDEDVFDFLGKEVDAGVGIKVGDAAETAAAYRIPDITGVREFLVEWDLKTGRQ